MKQSAKSLTKKRIQKLLSLIMFVTLVLFNISYSFSAILPLTVVYNGKALDSDVPPIIVQGRVYIPFRVIYEAIGAQIEWNDETKSLFATYGNHKMFLQVGNSDAYVNDQKYILDTPSFIKEGRVLVPTRFVAESLGIDIKWNDKKRVVTLSSQDYLLAENSPANNTPTPTPTPNISPTPVENSNNTTGNAISNTESAQELIITELHRNEEFAYSTIDGSSVVDEQGNTSVNTKDSIVTILYRNQQDFDALSKLSSSYLRKLVYTSVIYRMDIRQYRYVKVKFVYNRKLVLQADINATMQVENIVVRDGNNDVISR